MKKRLATIILLAFTATSLVACGNSSNEAESTADTTIETEVVTSEPTATPEPTEAPHEHAYTEEVTKEPTCLEDGESTFTCECGDTYTEAVPATGHDFSNYVSNEDATYTADGTETATCTCGETDTRVAEGSMLTYTFEDMDATKYAKSTVNVRSLPNTDGEKLGGLSTNDEVKVTGKCAETGWYRIEYADSIAYVSDDYLVDNKVEVAKASAPAASSDMPTFASYAEVKEYAISLGYPICNAVNNGDGTATTYCISVSDNAGHNESWEHEYKARLADFTASRIAGESLVGGSIYKEDIVSIVKIAKTAEGYHWTVITERAYCK